MLMRYLVALLALLVLAPVARAQEVRTYPTGEVAAEQLIAHFVGPDALLVEHTMPSTQLELLGHGKSLRVGTTTHNAFQAAPEGIAGYVVAIDNQIYAVDRDVTKSGPAYRVANGSRPLAVGTQGSTAVVAYTRGPKRYRVVKVHVRPDLSIRRYSTSTHDLAGKLVGLLPDGRAAFDTRTAVTLKAADGTQQRIKLPASSRHRYTITQDAVYVTVPVKLPDRYRVVALRWDGHVARQRTVNLALGLTGGLNAQVAPGVGNGFHAFIGHGSGYYDAMFDALGARRTLTAVPTAMQPAPVLARPFAGPGDALISVDSDPPHNELFASRIALDPTLGVVSATAPLPGGSTLVVSKQRTWRLDPDGTLTLRPALPEPPDSIATALDGSGWMFSDVGNRLYRLATNGTAGSPITIVDQPLRQYDSSSQRVVVALTDGSALVARLINGPGDDIGAGPPYRTCFVHVAVDGSQTQGDCVDTAGWVIPRAGGAAILAFDGIEVRGVDAAGHITWERRLDAQPSGSFPAATGLPDGSFSALRNVLDTAGQGSLALYHFADDGTVLSGPRPIAFGPGNTEYLTPMGLYNVNRTTVTQLLTGAELSATG